MYGSNLLILNKKLPRRPSPALRDRWERRLHHGRGKDKAADPSGTTRACGCPRHWRGASDLSATCGTRGSRHSCSSTRESGKLRLKNNKTNKVGGRKSLNDYDINKWTEAWLMNRWSWFQISLMVKIVFWDIIGLILAHFWLFSITFLNQNKIIKGNFQLFEFNVHLILVFIVWANSNNKQIK